MMFKVFGLVISIVIILIVFGILTFPWLVLLCDLYCDWVEELQLKIYKKENKGVKKE